MDRPDQQFPGFSPHLQNQLHQASQSRRGRGENVRGGGTVLTTRGRGSNQHHSQTQYQSYGRGHFNGPQYPQQAQSWNQQPVTNSIDMNSFPPLGATRQQHSQSYQPQNQHIQPQQPIRPHEQSSRDLALQNSNKEFHNRGRGRGGPFRGRGQQPFHHNQPHNQSQSQSNTANADSFNRPPPAQRKLFTGGNHPHFSTMEEQRAFQRRIMDQSDFLNFLANQSLKNQLTSEEQQAKECFRKDLETIAQKVVTLAKTDDIQINPEHVKLKLYGSLGSGFAVAGSDMDLILAFPQNEGPLGDIEINTRRMLEKALLDAGIGARLLTNTRVPILRVCEKPSSELLQNLRDYRLRWEESLLDNEQPPVDQGWGPLPILTKSQFETAAKALTDLDYDAIEIPIPTSPPSEQSKLEYTGDCGIQCDINFSNYVALHNTRLLKTYGSCDSRVRQVGVFVKNWAKARDINTPYRGTLSSYGYILMVLHYLMNVVNPPVIPNLQELAKQKDTWEGINEPELFEGFDVRFIRDTEEIEAIMKDMPRNHESVGALLRGFFWYYADHRGFHWNLGVISIRSRNGRMDKKIKGWTEAKRSGENQTVKLRYLLAIEDPFEVDHNIARTVGHSGIVAIREEFRRAWSIIEGIKFDNEARMWYWLADDGQTIPGQAMMAIAENRGDLHRKDQNFHRQKIRQMRLDVEAKEKALQEAAAEGIETGGELRTNDSHAPPFLALINNGASQVTKYQQKQSRRTLVLDDDDDEQEEKLHDENGVTTQNVGWDEPTQTAHNVSWEGPSLPTKKFDWDAPFGEKELAVKPEWAEHHMEPPINEWNNAGEPEHTSNDAQVVVSDSAPKISEPTIATKKFDWDAPFGEKELAIQPEWAENHMDSVINEWDDAAEPEQVPNDAHIPMSQDVLGVEKDNPEAEEDNPEVEEDNLELEEPKMVTKTFDWDAPFGEKELAIQPEWAENHMDPVINEWDSAVESKQVSNDAHTITDETAPEPGDLVPEGDESVPEADEPKLVTETPDWNTPHGEKDLAANSEWVESRRNPTMHHAGNSVEPEQLPERLPNEAQAGSSESVPEVSESFPHPTSTAEGAFEEPLKVSIAWNQNSAAGRWLLWRDDQIHAGTWTSPINQAYRELDEKFPYEPEMTMAQLAVKNKILGSPFWKNLNPQQADRPKVYGPTNSTKTDASVLSITSVSSVQSLEPISYDTSNKSVTDSVRSNNRRPGKGNKYTKSSQQPQDMYNTRFQDQATSQTNWSVTSPPYRCLDPALSESKRRNQNPKRNKRRNLPRPDHQTQWDPTTVPPGPSHASLLLALLTPKASAPPFPPSTPVSYTNTITDPNPHSLDPSPYTQPSPPS